MPACASCGGPNTEEAKFCPNCGAPIASAAPVRARARKVVTVLFSDVSGFTALAERLDPESLHQVIGRWFDRADRVLERHGGTVEKHMGDAVMAVFGAPVAHEDDAVRAARAALEMAGALAALNEELVRRWGVELSARTGVNTGEVVVGGGGGESSVLGDAVNVAQRLEAAAEPGQVLIGEQTARLLRGVARLEPIPPLTLKGKAAPVSAWRLDAVVPSTADLRPPAATPFVGRTRELELLRAAFAGVVARRTPAMVTVAGPAGIGKSRLARAFLDGVGGEATAVVGRCLPYGDAITYWPVTEIVRQLGATDEQGLVSLISSGDPEAEQARLIASRVARALRFASGSVAVDETQWAVRKLLEGAARSRPLVVAVEDIHWATPTLLDLIEHLATATTGAPLLLVNLTRPELLEERPGWLEAGGESASVIELEPLPSNDSAELLDRLAEDGDLTSEQRTALLTAAEGNPFYLEQMVAMRAEIAGDAATAIPPTIQAVLTARIDRLSRGEREVLEQASIEGRTFHRGPLIDALEREQWSQLDEDLAALARRNLIRLSSADLEGERAFRFGHILIRDAIYALIPKQRRAELHEQHARWLERRGDQVQGEHEEVAGYHLERAFGYHVEVEPAATITRRELAATGGRHLAAAGRTALARDDLPAAIRLLERAMALLPEDDLERGAIAPELGTALTEAGRLDDAERALDTAVEQAAARGDAIAEAHAVVVRLLGRLMVDTEPSAEEVRDRFDALRATLERGGNDLALDRLWRLRALVHWIEARSAEAEAAWARAAEHARRAGDEQGLADVLTWLASSAYFGPTPVDEGLARCEEIAAQLSPQSRPQAIVLETLAGLRAMRGEFETARVLLAEANAIHDELGRTMLTAVSHPEAIVAMASGDAAGAEKVLRAGYERLERIGERALLATTAVMLARALYDQGRLEEAWALTQVGANAAADDLSVQIGWRSERARLLARRGAMAEAKRISAEAVRLAERTDWLVEHADALVARAQVLQAAGEAREARAALDAADALYRRKGNTIGVHRAHSLLAAEVPA
jgi:class 3 adenylate cyclase/tetratricopeptide (TPR) repeat protein